MSQIVINAGARLLDADGSCTVGLFRPLSVEGLPPVTHLRLLPVSAEQIERWADADFESTFGLLAEMAELPEKAVASLGGADLVNAMFCFDMMLTPDIRRDFQNARFPLVSGYRRQPAPVTVLEEPEEVVVAEPPKPPPPQPEPMPAPAPQPSPQPPPDFKGPVVIPTKRTHPLPPNPKDPRYPDISRMRVDESGAVIGITPPNVMERAS